MNKISVRNEKARSRYGAYLANMHSGAISNMGRWCRSGNMFKIKDGGFRWHVTTTSRIKIPEGNSRSDSKSYRWSRF